MRASSDKNLNGMKRARILYTCSSCSAEDSSCIRVSRIYLRTFIRLRQQYYTSPVPHCKSGGIVLRIQSGSVDRSKCFVNNLNYTRPGPAAAAVEVSGRSTAKAQPRDELVPTSRGRSFGILLGYSAKGALVQYLRHITESSQDIK